MEAMACELEWAAGRPCSSWQENAENENVLPLVDDATSFEATLTETEQRFLKGYEDKMPNGVYSLNQNPDVTSMGTNGKVGRCLKVKAGT